MIYAALIFLGCSLGLSGYVMLLLALHYAKPRKRASMVPVTRHVDITA
jgi:hypothetical protein